jgi:hypothetical protein
MFCVFECGVLYEIVGGQQYFFGQVVGTNGYILEAGQVGGVAKPVQQQTGTKSMQIRFCLGQDRGGVCFLVTKERLVVFDLCNVVSQIEG